MMFFPRVISDKEVRPSDYQSANLILFGTKETNLVIEKLADKLPLHLNNEAKDLSLTYVYPVDGRYIVINSGLPWWTGTEGNGFQMAPHAALNNLKDFLFFKTSNKNILVDGLFNNDWKLAEEQWKVLTQNGVAIKQ
jgi:hypothetical protein